MQVILNLAYNAIKYTFKGNITIRIKLNLNLLLIEVEDSGIGIPKEDLSKLTQLFGLVDRKSSDYETGIGLGLIVSKEIILALGGTLNISSDVGIGTKCRVNLPLEECESNSILVESPEEDRKINKKTIKVLVVDDEPFIQFAIGSMLTRLDCIVDKASNGTIAYELVKEKNKKEESKFDIIFMDINMPVCNGYESTRLIRKEPIIQVPIICLSAQESSQHQHQCNEVGMTEVSK